MTLGREETIPKYRYLSREEILSLALNGRLTEDKLQQAAPMIYNFPNSKFKKARMATNPFIEAWKKLPDKKQEIEVDIQNQSRIH